MENKDLNEVEEKSIEEIEINEALKSEIYYLNKREKKLLNKIERKKSYFEKISKASNIEEIKENIAELYTFFDNLSDTCEEKHNIILGLLSKFKRKEEKEQEKTSRRTKIEVVGIEESMLDSDVLVEPNVNYKISLRNFPKHRKK